MKTLFFIAAIIAVVNVSSAQKCCTGFSKQQVTFTPASPTGNANPMKCGATYTVSCNTPIYLNSKFTCIKLCPQSVTYKIMPSGAGASITGNVFKSSKRGMFTITEYYKCGKNICDSCVFHFCVTGGCCCDMQQGATPVAIYSTKYGNKTVHCGDKVVLCSGTRYNFSIPISKCERSHEGNCERGIVFTLPPGSKGTIQTNGSSFEAGPLETNVVTAQGGFLCGSCTITVRTESCLVKGAVKK